LTPQLERQQSPTRTGVEANRPATGFLLERGRFKPVAIPRGLEDLARQGIAPIDINDRGRVVGEYRDAADDFYGYVWERGRFRTMTRNADDPLTVRARLDMAMWMAVCGTPWIIAAWLLWRAWWRQAGAGCPGWTARRGCGGRGGHAAATLVEAPGSHAHTAPWSGRCAAMTRDHVGVKRRGVGRLGSGAVVGGQRR
jgi:hypothetical protein